KNLHLFSYTHAMDLGDMAYSYNNKKGGVYFYWDVDAGAFTRISAAASSFSPGHTALFTSAGMAIGIIGTIITERLRRRKKQPTSA
nr:hypothetical protein [Lachnospiraceae bacterium]